MSDEVTTLAIKLGELTHRMQCMEEAILHSGALEMTHRSMHEEIDDGYRYVKEEYIDESEILEDCEPPKLHRFVYPLQMEAREVSNSELRAIKHSSYHVKIIQSLIIPPRILEADLTRNEVDDLINSNPAKSGEWIVSIKPNYEDQL